MYQTKYMLTRPLSYKHRKGEDYVRKFAIAITFEIDVTGYSIIRLEPTYFDLLSAVGGLSSILLAISQFVGLAKNTQLFVTSAMFRSDESDKKAEVHTPNEI